MLAGDHTETDSAISDSLSQAANSHMFQPPVSPHPDRTMSPHSHAGIGGSQHPAYSEVMPGDSTSVANADDNRSTVSSHAAAGTFAFKFNYGSKAHRFRCEYSSYAVVRDHVRQKIMADHLSLSQSYVKVEAEEQEHDDDNWLNIAYLDDEDDEVLMTCDSDLQDAVELARKQGHDRVRLFVHDAVAEQQQQQKAAEEAAAAAATQASVEESMTTTQSGTMDAPPGQPTISAMQQQQVENEDDNDKQHQRSIRRRHRHRHDNEDSTDTESATSEDEEEEGQMERQRRRHRRRGGKRDAAADLNLPIPQEMLLPAAITFLGVVILGVFTITKLTGSSSDRRF